MAEDLLIQGNSKEEKYQILLPQLQSLIKDEADCVANLGNLAAGLKETFGFFWVGFYWVKNEVLVLGPFQGSVACTRIAKSKGVCGAAWEQKTIQLVPDVELFPGHIACSSFSRSEIVIPILHGETVVGVLDVDSDQYDDFDKTDAEYLSIICQWISAYTF